MDRTQILYEDKDIIVCHKPAGIATQTAKIGQRDMASEVANYLAASDNSRNGQAKPYVGLVHRLDQPVEGILVFAKNPKAANALSRQITENQMEKYYYAVISCGGLPEQAEDASELPEGTLIDYLLKDGKTNTSSVVLKERSGAKCAKLYYKIRKRITIKEFPTAEIALAEIRLITGRHHQIRVQMSHAGMSLLGDYKYADGQAEKLSEQLQQKQVALCAYKLGFRHPLTDRQMWFEKMPEGEIFQKFL